VLTPKETMKLYSSIIFSLMSCILWAQSNSRWEDYFSYNNVKVLCNDNQQILAATENGLFYYNLKTNELKKFSKVNGLHEVKITAFDYNSSSGKMLIGYASGNLDLIQDNQIYYIPDIPRLANFNGDKRINHISIKDNQAVVSTQYGLSIFNLDRKEFEDSAFFVQSNVFTAVVKSVFYQNKIYAATANGLFYHELNPTFPVYDTWQIALAGDIKSISAASNLVAATATQVFSEC
jgi:ligand-binding sensor domain-containing protein